MGVLEGVVSVGGISGNTKSKKNAFSKKAPQGLSYRGSHFSKLEVWLIDEALEIDLCNTLMFSSALNQIVASLLRQFLLVLYGL